LRVLLIASPFDRRMAAAQRRRWAKVTGARKSLIHQWGAIPEPNDKIEEERKPPKEPPGYCKFAN
jgi:hypothetical protein